MCEPLISRTRLAELTPRAPPRKLDTQGPAALTSARARTRAALAGAVDQVHQPAVAVAAGMVAAGPGADHRPALGRVHGVERHEPAVLDPAVGVGEAAPDPGLERIAQRTGCGEIDGGRARAGSRGRPGDRRAGGPGGSARPAAARGCAAGRRSGARRCAGPRAAAPRARSAPRGPAGTRSIRGSAGRHGSAWRTSARCGWRDRPSRPAGRTGRGPPHRARCRHR